MLEALGKLAQIQHTPRLGRSSGTLVEITWLWFLCFGVLELQRPGGPKAQAPTISAGLTDPAPLCGFCLSKAADQPATSDRSRSDIQVWSGMLVYYTCLVLFCKIQLEDRQKGHHCKDRLAWRLEGNGDWVPEPPWNGWCLDDPSFSSAKNWLPAYSHPTKQNLRSICIWRDLASWKPSGSPPYNLQLIVSVKPSLRSIASFTASFRSCTSHRNVQTRRNGTLRLAYIIPWALEGEKKRAAMLTRHKKVYNCMCVKNIFICMIYMT